jgi:high-affinity iron transporter
MQVFPTLVLLALLAAPLAAAAGEGDPVADFLAALESVEAEYQGSDQAQVEAASLPALQASWADARPTLLPEYEHQAEEVDTAMEDLATKIRDRAPASDVVAIIIGIEHEIGETRGEVAPASVSGFTEGAHEFREKLAAIGAAYAAGDVASARSGVREAYAIYGPKLEGSIRAADPAINERIEKLLNQDLVAAIEGGMPVTLVDGILTDIDTQVDAAEAAVATGTSAFASFFNAFLILVREGFEAMLVVGALATYLIRTGHKNKARLLYGGAAAGVIATLALWFLVRALLKTLPVDPEILAGVTALLAVAVLFYVSYWLISKIEVGRWNRFVQGKMKGALATGSAFTLVGVAFLAVFREGFETVLFYQGLYASGTAHGIAITTGLVLGALVLTASTLAFYRFGVKLPLRPFFIVTSALLYYLALAFMGSGIHALQEAGIVSTSVLPMVDRLLDVPFVGGLGGLLGVYPTVETLVSQAVLLAIVALGLAWTFFIGPMRDAKDSGIDA